MNELPMPPVNEFGPIAEPPRFFRYVFSSVGVPKTAFIEGLGEARVLTLPGLDGLVIYGREVTSPFEEDLEGLRLLARRGRVMGEWFSVACPEGELGSQDLGQCEQISAERFSAAYARAWR